MSELEALISKHLDGELTPSELAELRRLLASDPDAREVYREMTAIRRAARRAPALRGPSASTEARLFQQLHREGLSVADAPPAAVAQSISGRFGRRIGVVASLAVAILIAIAGVVTTSGDDPRPVASVSDRSAGVATGIDAGSGAGAPRGAASAPAATTRPLASVEAPRTSTDIDLSIGGSAVASRSISRRSVTAVDRDGRGNGAVLGRHDDARQGDARPSVPVERENSTKDEAGRLQATAPEENAFASDTAQRAPQLELPPSATPPVVDQPAIATLPEIIPIPVAGEEDRSFLSASFRLGGSQITHGSRELTEELGLGIGFDLGAGHQLALLGGRSAAVTEQRAVNTHSIPARAAVADEKGGGSGLARTEETPADYDMEVGNEWWVGLGYAFTIQPLVDVKELEIGLGVRGGLGVRSTRVGGEIPIRVNVSRSIALELVPSAAHVMPHERNLDEMMIQSASDGFIYETEREHAAFSTFGIELGVRVALD